MRASRLQEPLGERPSSIASLTQPLQLYSVTVCHTMQLAWASNATMTNRGEYIVICSKSRNRLCQFPALTDFLFVNNTKRNHTI